MSDNMTFKPFKFGLAGIILFVLLSVRSQAQYDPLIGREFYIQAAGAYEEGRNLGFWDVPGTNPQYQEGQNIQVWAKDGGDDRKFIFNRDPQNPGYYTITSKHARNARVEVARGVNGNGVNVQLGNANGSASQCFQLKYLPDGNIKIINKNGMVVCLSNRSYQDGSNIHTWEDHDGLWMEWVLINPFDGTPFANHIPLPCGRVTVPAGYNVEDANVFFYTDKYNSRQPLTTKPNANGEFSFPSAEISDNDYNALLLVVLDGLTSEYYQYHKSKRAGNLVFDLKEVPQGAKLIKTKHRGYIPYKPEKYWVNVRGVINRQDNFFFRDLEKQTPEKQQLRNMLGLKSGEAINDKDVYEITRKVWDFFAVNTKSIMVNNGDMTETVKAAFKECGEKYPNGAVKYWPTVEQFMNVYSKYNFIPIGNCSSQALAFAALLRAAGVPANKVAVERMNYNWLQDHWAVIVEINSVWYWFDTTHQGTKFPEYQKLTCIPYTSQDFNYDLPYEIIPVPGSALNYVPYCGKEGVVAR
ncbi:MAG: RICIN domain-containing protein [Bacteroidales bacterium]